MRECIGIMYLSISSISSILLLLIGGCEHHALWHRPWKTPTRSSSLFVNKKHYPFSSQYFERYIQRLNSRNVSEQKKAILEEMDLPIQLQNNATGKIHFETYQRWLLQKYPDVFNTNITTDEEDEYDYNIPEAFYRPHHPPADLFPPENMVYPPQPNMDPFEDHETREKLNKEFQKQKRSQYFEKFHRPQNSVSSKDPPDHSDNFQVIRSSPVTFQDIGGYGSIKDELMQCVDLLRNYNAYSGYNVRIPKGLIFEGPPGNGKTLLAKGFAGEANCSFIAVSGSEFQEKYVGIGSSRIKELFTLAEENKPCIIFIDEIDALGRKRSGDGESSSSERDNTLNQLLVSMDGFKSTHGIFVVGATNRADLLDPALTRPGRVDKRIFIALPDSTTREAILNIHIQGKPCDSSVVISDMVDLTNGMSASQIENVLNEAMLLAIRENRTQFTQMDIDVVMNRILVGWQPTEHQFSKDMIERITVHEMGHAMVGLLAKQHSKMTKIVINLSSPNTPGYTVFEGQTSALYTRESLFEHLMILLAGRVAEEVFYNVSVTTGAINDFEEALKLAQKMVVYYGMGEKLIYPSNSDHSKEMIDTEVIQIIHDAYQLSHFIVSNCKNVIQECATKLETDKIIRRDELLEMIREKYPEVLELYVG